MDRNVPPGWQPRDQLDGGCGLPEARAHRDAPLQHDGRFDMVQGRVSRKYIKDRHALVDIEIWGENQRARSRPRASRP
jgi:hypothetical protein